MKRIRIPILGSWASYINNRIKLKKTNKTLVTIYSNELVIEKLDMLFDTKFKTDKVGRLYTIINPSLNNIKDDSTNLIYENTENGLDKTEFVEKWVLKNMGVLQTFLIDANLFEMIGIDVSHVGPEDHDNYLIIIYPLVFKEYEYNKYRFVKETIIGIVILLGVFVSLLTANYFLKLF